MNNLRFGPLSKPPVGKLDKKQLTYILQSYKKDPKLADFALDLAREVDKPEVLAKGLEVVSGLVSSEKFGPPPEETSTRARNSLKLGCIIGGDWPASNGVWSHSCRAA